MSVEFTSYGVCGVNGTGRKMGVDGCNKYSKDWPQVEGHTKQKEA